MCIIFSRVLGKASLRRWPLHWALAEERKPAIRGGKGVPGSRDSSCRGPEVGRIMVKILYCEVWWEEFAMILKSTKSQAVQDLRDQVKELHFVLRALECHWIYTVQFMYLDWNSLCPSSLFSPFPFPTLIFLCKFTFKVCIPFSCPLPYWGEQVFQTIIKLHHAPNVADLILVPTSITEFKES